MDYVLIIHEVEDHAGWEKGFDQASALWKSTGEIQYQVLEFENEPNKVVHFSRWASFQQAKDFFESNQVQEIRQRLGVGCKEA